MPPAFASVDDYISTFPDEVQTILERVRRAAHEAVPGAGEMISYNMPAFRDQRVFMYFAAFKKHIGIYPPVDQDLALVQELAKFRGPKGNLSFPLTQPLPMELIERVILALHQEYVIK